MIEKREMAFHQYDSQKSNINHKFGIRKSNFSNINIISSDKSFLITSRLPIRSKSKSMSDKNYKFIRNIGKGKLPIGSVSTWSDLSIDSERIRTYSGSISRLNSTNGINIKTEIRSRNPQFKAMPKLFVRSQPKHGGNVQVPIHRNNSSCGKLTKLHINPITDYRHSPLEKTNNATINTNVNTIPKKEMKCKNLQKQNFTSCSSSIFRLFRMKIDLYREKHRFESIKELKEIDSCSLQERGKQNDECKILNHPLSKEFLLKLYNECRKLNDNIMKLSKDTDAFNNRFSSLYTVENLLNKYQSLICNAHKKLETRSPSMNLINQIKSSSIDESSNNGSHGQHRRSQSDHTSARGVRKTLDEDNGHYYHLACVLSSDQDPINASIISTKIDDKLLNLLYENESKFSQKNVHLTDEITNLVSYKLHSTASLKADHGDYTNIHLGNIPNVFYDNKDKEFDDTLCDLDDNMKTDSLEDSKGNIIDLKSPVSLSNYLTANENLPLVKSRTKDFKGYCAREPNLVTGLFEMPPIPVIKDFGIDMLSQISYPDIEPPECMHQSNNYQKSNPISTGLQLHVSQYVAVLEKQYPQQMILISPKNKPDPSIVYKNQGIPKFSSSITVNCNKEKNKTNSSFHQADDSCCFNPFKPPKGSTIKLMQFLNSNNNNSSNAMDNSHVANSSNSISDKSQTQLQNGSSFPEMEFNKVSHTTNLDIESVDNTEQSISKSTSEEPLKRIAPLKELLKNSRNSDKMQSVFNSSINDGRKSPSNNVYIEIQREKKITRQKEQHQKAKDMAVEAARIRKERQAEIQSLESFDSSRIVEKLFTENVDLNYPEFSLYDACHYNFTKKHSRKPRPLAVSTITGILPEEPIKSPEPQTSPLTDEKFRNEPIQLIKRIQTKQEFSKEELQKYEPIGYLRVKPTESIASSKLKESVKTEANKQTVHNISEIENKSSSSGTSKSSKTKSDSSSADSVSSFSAVSTTSEPSSGSSNSSQLSSDHSNKVQKTHTKTKSSSKRNKTHSSKKRVTKKCEIELKNNGISDLNIISDTAIKKNNIVDKPEPEAHVKINVNSDIKETKKNENENEIKKSNSKNPLKLIFTENDDVLIKRKENNQNSHCRTTSDANVSTEDGCNVHQASLRSDNNLAIIQVDEKEIMVQCRSQDHIPNTVCCHLNHQRNYNENIIDRTLSVNINVPAPDTSLSAFVQELNSQLHSLADTVDILLKRMDIFEANLLDSTKYFFYK